MELVKPGVVDVPPVQGHDAVRFKDEVSGLVDVVRRAGGDPHEGGNVAVVVEQAWSLIAPLVVRNLAHGKTLRHRSMTLVLKE